MAIPTVHRSHEFAPCALHPCLRQLSGDVATLSRCWPPWLWLAMRISLMIKSEEPLRVLQLMLLCLQSNRCKCTSTAQLTAVSCFSPCAHMVASANVDLQTGAVRKVCAHNTNLYVYDDMMLSQYAAQFTCAHIQFAITCIRFVVGQSAHAMLN